jgi:Endosomal/lysosomal potassium channel TMEM175
LVISTDPGAASRRDDAPRVNRLLTLSDGVVAIALTLLVLQLRVPALDQVADPDSAADLAAQLGKGSAQLVSYGIAFYVIAQFWLVHRQVFRLVRDQEILLKNGRSGISAMPPRLLPTLLPCRWTTTNTDGQSWNVGPAYSPCWTVVDNVPTTTDLKVQRWPT